MSQFLREFEAILHETNGGSASSVFQAAGLDAATISRIRNAGLKIQFENIKRLAAALGTSEMIYLRLLRARLLDECTDPRASRISIEISGDRRKLILAPADDCLSKLPPRQEKAMRNIAAALPHDAGLRSTILWMGEDLFSSAPAEAATEDAVAFALAETGAAAAAPPAPAAALPRVVRYQKGAPRAAKKSSNRKP